MRISLGITIWYLGDKVDAVIRNHFRVKPEFCNSNRQEADGQSYRGTSGPPVGVQAEFTRWGWRVSARQGRRCLDRGWCGKRPRHWRRRRRARCGGSGGRGGPFFEEPGDFREAGAEGDGEGAAAGNGGGGIGGDLLEIGGFLGE